MGQSRERVGKDGKSRYTAYYEDIRGARRSAGTFSSRREADRAWQRAEARLDAGKIGDPKRGRQTLAHYVQTEWLPHHVIEASTRETYTYLLNRYILPGKLGTMRMVEILPGHVREWVLDMLHTHQARPPTIRNCKVVLDAILTTALNDQVTFLHAGRGVQTPAVARKPKRILTAEHFDALYEALDDDTMRLLVETDIESGLRWGELTELRVKSINYITGILTVSAVVVHLKAKDRPTEGRFLVKRYPKDREWRQFKIADHLVVKLKDHVTRNHLGPNDLLFSMPVQDGPRRRTLPEDLPDPATLGLTEPNEKGRQYQHGTLTAYQAGKCRCRHCKNAVASYRAARRAGGKDQPRPAHRRHRRAHQRRLVPGHRLEEGPRRRRPGFPRHPARPQARPRLVAAGRRRRPPDRQGTTWARQHHHDRELSSRPARSRRHRPGRAHRRPRQPDHPTLR